MSCPPQQWQAEHTSTEGAESGAAASPVVPAITVAV
jgi:hypothetical protein